MTRVCRLPAAPLALAGLLTFAVAGAARATDVAVAGKALSATVNNAAGKAKLVSAQKGIGISVGAPGSPADLSAQLEVYYVDTPANAADVAMPSPWLRNSAAVARYKNGAAPLGPSLVRSATTRPDRLAKVIAKGLGGLDISTAPGNGGVVSILTVDNAGDSSQHRHCSRYSLADGSTILHRVTSSGFKLRLRNGVPIPCPTCTDAAKNGRETGIDCGGTCAACADGLGCNDGGDCQSGVCSGNLCQAPTCSDGVENGGESDVDCGGGCAACATGLGCGTGADCQTGICSAGTCVLPPCANGVQDNAETDVDCGGGDCPACADGDGCGAGSDCVSGVCFANVCQAPTCTDSAHNGDETDIDCGGSCGPCNPGEGCASASDCTSGVCTANLCQTPTCNDGVQNDAETGVDCGGNCPVCSCQLRGTCLMFVTSTSSGGNLGGLAGGDGTCNARAAAASLPGVFQAWLCDGVTAPASRSLHATVPYRRTDGVLIANNWSDLTDGSIANPINRTEGGVDVSGSSPFLPWTLVTTSGTCDNETYLSPGSGPCPAFSNCPLNCANNGGNNGWTSSSGFAQGSKGDINATNGNWTDGVTGLCSTPAERIYCIEQ